MLPFPLCLGVRARLLSVAGSAMQSWVALLVQGGHRGGCNGQGFGEDASCIVGTIDRG